MCTNPEKKKLINIKNCIAEILQRNAFTKKWFKINNVRPQHRWFVLAK